MTSLPDWLVERAALDEIPATSRDRIERADPRALAGQITALREANAAELVRHPAGPAVAQLEARVAAERRRRTAQRRRRFGLLGLATGAAAVLLVTRLGTERADHDAMRGGVTQGDGTRVKGAARLLVFRQAGAQIEQLEQDTVVRAGDLIQLRYNAGGQRFGLIASIDGAGVVTLHFPVREDAPPEATAVPPDTATLPDAYALDDAPRFERFVFITANDPIDVPQALAALRALAG
ncbi:MAG: hypothetical protein ABIY55_23385, partial [Kofleriaceae bacterium]